MKRNPVPYALLLGAFMLASCSSPPVQAEGDAPFREDESAESVPLPAPDPPAAFERGDSLPVSAFPEIWAYVVAGGGREASLRRGLPLSDIGYFGATVNLYGELSDVPDRRNLPAFPARVHLVVADTARTPNHFVLMPASAARRSLIASLIAAARPFDGLQIDFEHIPAREYNNFLSFLAEIRAGLGADKIFSVCVPGRWRHVGDFDYEKIAAIADRVFVMAYDEHWSTSAPGPIASLDWGRRVADYALRTIGREKLVMGLPFYGRGWARPSHAQAYVWDGIQRIIRENGVTEIRRENGIPTFGYDAAVSVTVYFEDEYSLSSRMEMYRQQGVTAIGFWRLGQETPAVWPRMRLGN